MKHDIKEISYTFQKDKQDKELIYKIDFLLSQEIDSIFIANLKKDKNIDKTYYDILNGRDAIIDSIVVKILNSEIINDYKASYLVNEEFTKVLNKVKRFYIEENKTKKVLLKQKEQKEIEKLKERLRLHFDFCFNQMKTKKPISDILTLMSSNDFRVATIEDLKLNTSDYIDFNKIYDKELLDYKKRHKNDLQDYEGEGEKIGFGWKLYLIIKVVEGLFKI